MKPITLLLILLIIICSIYILAQNKPADAVFGDAAADAFNPAGFVIKLLMQPNFTWKEDKARQINLTVRILQPSASIGLSFIKSKYMSKVYTIYRLELPLIGQTYSANPKLDGTGLSDIALVDLVAFKRTSGLVGAGPGPIVPTVKPATISGGKWCAGLAAVVVNTKTKGLVYGASVQQFFRFLLIVAANRPAILCC